MDKRVKKAMEPFWTENFGNPNALYKEGLVARGAIETAREDVAKVLGARAKEIIFTAGGTESDNLAILGVIGSAKQNFSSKTKSRGNFVPLRTDEEGNSTGTKIPSAFGKLGHIITTKFEHHAVLNTCKFLETQGFEITYLDVGKDGIVNPERGEKGVKAGNNFSFYYVCQ